MSLTANLALRTRVWRTIVWEFLLFGFKQAWACLFGGLFLICILATTWYYPSWMPLYRYDFLVFCALGIQALLIATKLEHWDEAKVIFIFHIVGTLMELFKTQVGSWSYPEESYLRIMSVPLFSGFMYSAVGSYIARVWRIFDFRFSNYPDTRLMLVLAIAIYINFFTHHYTYDIRYILFALTAYLLWTTRVHFTVDRSPRWMPLGIGFMLVALFIWIAENIGSFSKVWLYPHQHQGFQLVTFGKFGSWFLLMIISFVLVTLIRRPETLNASAPRIWWAVDHPYINRLRIQILGDAAPSPARSVSQGSGQSVAAGNTN